MPLNIRGWAAALSCPTGTDRDWLHLRNASKADASPPVLACQAWRAGVLPLEVEGELTDTRHSPPVCLQECVSKILTAILMDRLYPLAEQYGLQDPLRQASRDFTLHSPRRQLLICPLGVQAGGGVPSPWQPGANIRNCRRSKHWFEEAFISVDNGPLAMVVGDWEFNISNVSHLLGECWPSMKEPIMRQIFPMEGLHQSNFKWAW